MRRSLRPSIFLLALASTLGQAQDNPQQCVAKLQKIVSGNGFNATRGIQTYLSDFGSHFARDLMALDARHHWVDAGSGEGYAQREVMLKSQWLPAKTEYQAAAAQKESEALRRLPLERKPRMTGISYVMYGEQGATKMSQDTADGKLRFLTGRYFEDVPNAEIGKADLLTDMYGIMAYSHQPDRTLQKYAELLTEKGTAYIFMGHFNDLNLSKVRTLDGRDLSLGEWICSIDGLRCEITRSDRAFSPNNTFDVLRIQRKAGTDRVRVPRLEMVSVGAAPDSPAPIRIMREVD